jgi:hypothetical protein
LLHNNESPEATSILCCTVFPKKYYFQQSTAIRKLIRSAHVFCVAKNCEKAEKVEAKLDHERVVGVREK